MPEEVTQIGISAGVNINYSHVPRAVKRLLRDGLLFEVSARLINNPTGRRRKAYFLTGAGLSAAESLNSRLNNHPIIFKDKLGKTMKIMLGEIYKLIKKKEEPFTIYKFLSSDNIFDVQRWDNFLRNNESEVMVTKEPRTIVDNQIGINIEKKIVNSIPYREYSKRKTLDGIILGPQEYPFAKNFIGRKKELKLLSDELKSPGAGIILLSAPHGQGKSALIAKTIQVLFFQESPFDNIKKTTIHWCDVSGIKEKFKLKPRSQGPDDNIEKEIIELLSQIVGNLVKKRSILILDGLELTDNNLELAVKESINSKTELELVEGKINYKLNDLILKLKDQLGARSELKIIITTTGEINAQDLSKSRSKKSEPRLMLLRLCGLEFDEVEKILGSSFGASDVEAIYHHTGGNPQLINTIAEMDKSILDELTSTSTEERALSMLIMAQQILERKDN